MGRGRFNTHGHDGRREDEVCCIIHSPGGTDFCVREYDVSVDPEEPLQVLTFVPEKKRRMSYLAEDPAEREVASFTIGKGNADWGPLTIYALMKSGDVYALCPYMPQNACVEFEAIYFTTLTLP